MERAPLRRGISYLTQGRGFDLSPLRRQTSFVQGNYFSKEERERFRSEFSKWSNFQGLVQTGHLPQMLENLGRFLTKVEREELNQYLEELLGPEVRGESRRFQFDDFLDILKRFGDEEISHQEVREALAMFDRRGDGRARVVELRVAMEQVGEDMTEEELTAVLAEADPHGCGTVDMERFVSMLLGPGHAPEEENRQLLGGGVAKQQQKHNNKTQAPAAERGATNRRRMVTVQDPPQHKH